MLGSGRRRALRRRMKGGFLPALIPIIAAAIGVKPEEIWPTSNGYCGRWYCTIGDDPKAPPALRGFDLVVLKGDRIVLNEVYVHELIPGIMSGAAQS